jgi:chaperonin GroEL
MVYPGGGVALLYASKDLDKLPTANFDQKIGVQIIQNALKVCKKCRIRLIFFLFWCLYPCANADGWSILQTPVHTIAMNAGVEGAVVVGKLLEQDNTDLGYDAAKGRLLNHFLTNCLTLVLV